MQISVELIRQLYRSANGRWGVFKALHGVDQVVVVGEVYWDEGTDGNVDLEGSWESHKQYGQQFKITKIASAGDKDMEETIEGFKNVGLTDFESRVLIAAFGKIAFSVINKNPYRSMLADGIGFKRADIIAQKFNMERGDPRRAVGAAVWCLTEASRNGHCFLPLGHLLTSIQKLTGVPRRKVLEVLKDKESEPDNLNISGKNPEWYSIDKDRVWLTSCERMEVTIFNWLKQYVVKKSEAMS